jgi:hypothetical protein
MSKRQRVITYVVSVILMTPTLYLANRNLNVSPLVCMAWALLGSIFVALVDDTVME